MSEIPDDIMLAAREVVLNRTDEEAYEDFARRYGKASGTGYYEMACILSGRLRDLDKRAKAANVRADIAEHNLKGEGIACRSQERGRCMSILKSIGTRTEAEARMIEEIMQKVRGDE